MEFSYHGKAYHGWQKQPNAVSVQEIVENALKTLTQQSLPVVGAGRTDAGVHAKQLFAHVDVEKALPEEICFKLNSLLPQDIAISKVFEVKPEAHARFDAFSRTYEYHLVQQKDPFTIDTAFYVKKTLDVERMNKAAEILVEYTSFKCFSRSRTDVHTYNCKIEYAFWEREGERLVFHIKADRFLRNMVRAIVGTLMEIGAGKMEVEKMHEIIVSEDRGEAGASAPAHGLFLTRVEYPNSIIKN